MGLYLLAWCFFIEFCGLRAYNFFVMNFEIIRENPVFTEILKKNKVVLAYIFGSRVDGTAGRDSDLDIAVLFDRKLAKNQRFNLRLLLMSRLEKFFGLKIDLVVLNDVNSVFLKYIISSEGRLIFSSSEDEYLDFECMAMNEYFDFKDFLDLQNKNYVKNGLQ